MGKIFTDMGRIHITPSIKIYIGPLEPLPRISQNPVRKEAIQDIKSTVE